jgi:hypothetical protein
MESDPKHSIFVNYEKRKPISSVFDVCGSNKLVLGEQLLTQLCQVSLVVRQGNVTE